MSHTTDAEHSQAQADTGSSGPGLAPGQLHSKLKLDAPLPTLLGLLALWASLMLIFTAHRKSESYIHLDMPGIKSRPAQTALQSLDPHSELLLPLEMHLQGTTSRQALASLAGTVGFEIQDEDLKKVNKDARTILFNRIPLYQAIHEVLDKSSLGFALQGRRLLIFKQTLDQTTPADKKMELHWKADLELNEERVLVVPSATAELWFSVRLLRDLNSPTSQGRMVSVEVWNGTELVTMAKSMLGQDGKALLKLSTAENVAFYIERKQAQSPDAVPNAAPGTQQARYALEFYYQSFDTAH